MSATVAVTTINPTSTTTTDLKLQALDVRGDEVFDDHVASVICAMQPITAVVII